MAAITDKTAVRLLQGADDARAMADAIYAADHREIAEVVYVAAERLAQAGHSLISTLDAAAAKARP